MYLTRLLLALCAISSSSYAGAVLFSDLGPPASAYDPSIAWLVAGSACFVCGGTSFTHASSFTVGGSGAQAIDQIDLAASHDSGANTFFAAIWSDNSGAPGSELPGAHWELSTGVAFATCCDLISITGISGLTLTGGSGYYFVVGPHSATDNSINLLNFNNQGVIGNTLVSNNGGLTWEAEVDHTLGAFDILGSAAGVPEPGSMLPLGTALAGIAAAVRRRRSA